MKKYEIAYHFMQKEGADEVKQHQYLNATFSVQLQIIAVKSKNILISLIF